MVILLLLKQVVLLNLPSLRIAVCYLQYLAAKYVLAMLHLLPKVVVLSLLSLRIPCNIYTTSTVATLPAP
jgi:hypothetical protein